MDIMDKLLVIRVDYETKVIIKNYSEQPFLFSYKNILIFAPVKTAFF